ncbi:IS3 family transposase [Bacillus cereus]
MKVWMKVTYNFHLNHKRIQRLMNQLGIKAVIRKKIGICDFR